jgi:hypothetical protein
VVAGAAKLELSAADAGALFDELDADGSGALTKEEAGFFSKAWGRFRSPQKKKASAVVAGGPNAGEPFEPPFTDVAGLNEWKATEVVKKRRACTFVGALFRACRQ